MQKIFKFTRDDGPIGLIASPFLNARYVKGLKLAGLESFCVNGDEAFLGGILPIADALA